VALRLHGRHHVGNALSAIAAALECGLPLDAITVALAAAGPVSRWRMEVTERADGVTVVNDAYNANPDSMGAALRALRAMRGSAGSGSQRRAWAVLGEMFELGADTRTEHERVGAVAVSECVDRLVLVGAGAGPIGEGAEAAGMPPAHLAYVADTDAAYALLRQNLRPGDVVLFKSSRDAGLRWLGDRVAEPVHGSEVGS
jgi:UDP-N-acetylmuramoyl-tripeptide--D-alanyl-D-alanine ligase